ncbi:adenylate cyclase type 9 isoform X2 [Venturia canescens]|uniref:adenylate cyclase type 9 isoform X2 n=1 Tax=Venturia canescens TaxID=32260 RepID=UPI001C9C4283|nr:adenylate cyclase type 9 isoform X2 [Venturia canescens]
MTDRSARMTLANDRKRSSSVSYSKGKGQTEDGNDDIQISLAPYIQTYLAHSGHSIGCCGVGLPVPFERAAAKSWWNPRFDSEILEEQYKRSAFPQIRLRFRYALIYILTVSLSWLIYFVVVGTQNETSSWPVIASIFGSVCVTMLLALWLTYTKKYRNYVFPTSVGVATMMCLLSLLFLVLVPPHSDGLTLVGHFALCSEILLLIYTVMPMPLYACVGICTLYSILFEFLTAYLYNSSASEHYYYNNEFHESVIVRKQSSNYTTNTGETVTILGRGESRNSTSNESEIFGTEETKLLSSLGMAMLDGQKVVDKISKAIGNSDLLKNINPSTFLTNTINESLPISTQFSMGHPEATSTLINENQRFLDEVDFSTTLAIRILMQICIHIIGVHILIMTFVRMRGTFMKVGQSLLVRRQLEMEKQLKEKMIHSVMPPKVADWLMEESEREREREDSLKKGSIPSNHTDIRSLFRPFNMHSMEDVSILFADIVGFTRMSSNKTAEELVGILNDLFERFDDLCEHHGCEKISTLGDCYYCVSGCPEPRPDHAKCCVEMGLAMIEAIKQFDVERREGVNMRVGVHTGTVLCGIVGTKRFKFDVWSNDVTFANKLESTGKPGRVHFSEKTLSFLGDEYLTEPGDTINGLKSYFIKGRKSDLVSEFINNVNAPMSISPLMQSRHRLASCNNQFKPRNHYLHMVTNTSSYRMKANSLPSILDSENDEENDEKKDEASKSPISSASYGKKKLRSKPWRYLQRQRTTEEMAPLDIDNEKILVPPQETKVEIPVSTCEEGLNGFTGLFLMNGMAQGDLLGHRVSGYYTSSSTLNSTHEPSSSVPPYPFPPAVTDTFGACFHKLRKQSDLQLIRCVQDNVTSQRSYFVKPPLSSVTLFFKNREMEKEYRQNAHKVNENLGGNPPTLATSRFNTYFDIFVSALVYSAITASLFLLCKPTLYFVVFCSIATSIQAIVVMMCVRQLLNPNSIHATFTQEIFKFFSRWYPWHACGAVLVGLPIISILMNFSCNTFRAGLNHFEYYYSYLIFVGLVHFCNFTQLNCWMKNFLVALAGVLFICLVASHVSYKGTNESFSIQAPKSLSVEDNSLAPVYDDSAISDRRFRRDIDDAPPPPIPETSHNEAEPPVPVNIPIPKDQDMEYEQTKVTSTTTHSTEHDNLQTAKSVEKKFRSRRYNEKLYDKEIFLDMLLLLILVWFLNREFEISYRLSFHGNAVAARDKTRVQAMKNQADWLLHNIIPKYVADQLKTTAKYSQNHQSVGIIFASIVNFNELYDESYLGGKEYLRVLNELIGDFDEILEKPEFANVEKIKTIGSTFMAASGLNPQVRQQSEHEHSHLIELLDFAVAMHKVIYDFNRDLLGFKLILRVGYNHGDVTAGVIGATKLYYDIWGDAVNIASRMDSTGVAGRIQLASNCLDVLSKYYDFEPRGQVYVKGKDNMNVFLLKGKKNSVDEVVNDPTGE